MTNRPPLIEFLIKHQSSLIMIDFVKELFMIPDRMMAHKSSGDIFEIETSSPLYKDKLFVYDHEFYSIVKYERIDSRDKEHKTYKVTGTRTFIPLPDTLDPICTSTDLFTLYPNDIVNYTGDKPIETTIGRFIANYLFYVYPFGSSIPYLNEEFTASKMEKQISIRLLDGSISTQQVKDKYINALSLFGSSPEIMCPNISEKTITIPPEIHDLRDKLVSENREALERGDASVMSMIEKTLISKYKEYLKGDPSMDFLLKGKYFNVTLKKLFLTQGMVEVFGSPGKFTFVEQPMGSGWKQKDLPVIFNEVRAGSFARAVETADGGVIAKLILRVFQDTTINIPDCGTTRGEHVHGDKNILKEFLWNYVTHPDGSTTLINDTNIDEFVNKDIVIRTPGYCQHNDGFCAKCFGGLFESIGQKAFAPVANDFARQQTTQSLKSMHGKSHSTVDINDLNRFVL